MTWLERLQKTTLRLIPSIIWMGLIFYLSSIQNLELTGELSVYDFVLRKIAHMFEYGILFSLISWGLSKSASYRKRLFISATVAVLYAISDELHQHLVPTRDGKILDVLIDSSGVLISFMLVKYFYGKNLQQPKGNSSIRPRVPEQPPQ